MDNIDEVVIGFLRKVKYIAEDKEPSLVECVHLGQARSETIWKEEINGREFDPEELASALLKAAEEDCKGLGGRQRYAVKIYYGKSKQAARQQRFSLYEKDPWEDSKDLDSEAANPRGVLSQLMRHNEAIMRTSVLGQQDTLRALGRMNEKLVSRLEILESKHFETVVMYEELISQKHQREIEVMQAEASERRKDEMLSNLRLLVPIAINKLAGENVMKIPDTPETLQLRTFVESLDADQLQQILSSLNPAQQVSVMTMVQKFLPKDGEDKKNGANIVKREK